MISDSTSYLTDPEEPTLERLLEVIKENYPEDTDITMVQLSYEYAAEAHEGQMRSTGEPYITHPTAAAIKLAKMKLEIPVLVATLLHDVPEDTDRTFEDVEKNFGEDVMQMVAGVTKLGKVQFRGVDRYVENIRKMFYAMAQDIRTVFIKFADRLHNMETLDAIPENKRKRIAREVLEIYAPIANRLGMGEFKGLFEDLAFQHVYPEEHQRVKQLREKNLKARERSLAKTEKRLIEELEHQAIPAITVHGRVKRLYSLYKKLKRYDGDIARIYDVVAIRVVVPKIADCYSALGAVHKLWRPLKGRIKDYIAQPKPNGYQSIHTTIFGEDGMILELQIRTQEMHDFAEFGPAMHWRYKESDFTQKRYTRWIDELVKIQKELKNKDEFLDHLDDLKFDAFQDRIFVFTPKGDVLDLPEGSTPIDFAYAIHTEIGNKCISARVNDQIVNFDSPLKSGDLCEISIDKNRKSPNADWLRFVRTRHARNKIKDATKRTMKGWFITKIEQSGRRHKK
ncbi:MAG: RelA/SpoT family protein [bacterium]|nr:RelA/SpoT family protein [bacterium]